MEVDRAEDGVGEGRFVGGIRGEESRMMRRKKRRSSRRSWKSRGWEG